MSNYIERCKHEQEEVMSELLDKLIEEYKDASRIILDGFPRTITQLHNLVQIPIDELLKRAKK